MKVQLKDTLGLANYHMLILRTLESFSSCGTYRLLCLKQSFLSALWETDSRSCQGSLTGKGEIANETVATIYICNVKRTGSQFILRYFFILHLLGIS